MTKRLISLFLALLTVVTLGLTALAAEVPVNVNGTLLPTPNTVVENGTSYVSAHYVACALCPDTTASWENGQMVLRGSGYTLSVQPGQQYVVMNGRYLYVPGCVRTHSSGDLLVPSRVLGKAFGVSVWAESGVVYLCGDPSPLPSGDTYYNAADVELVARVVEHESGNQPLAGRIGVANCVLNRVGKRGFASSVSGVVHQSGQFPGATNAPLKDRSIIAVKLAMDGANTVGSALWFNGAGKPCWASRNKSLIATIGGHSFYG